jgi:Family of unknown function (DUF6069)
MASPGVAPAESNMWREGAVAGTIAGVTNVLIWGAGRAAGVSFDLVLAGRNQTVQAFHPFASSLVGALLAIVVLWLLAKLGRPSLWKYAVVGFVAVSLAQPFTAAEELSTALALGLMHVVVVVALLLMVQVPRRD